MLNASFIQLRTRVWMRHRLDAIEELAIPLDVAPISLFQRKTRRIADHLACLADVERSPLGHQRIAFHALHLDRRELRLEDVGHLVERPALTESEIEGLVLGFRPGNDLADPVNEVANVREVETLLAVALDRDVLAPHRVLDEHLSNTAADAALTIKR